MAQPEEQLPLPAYGACLEAILFACGNPFPIGKLAQILGISSSACYQQLQQLAERLEKNSGLTLLFLEDQVQLVTQSRYQTQIQQALLRRKNQPLGSSALEVLAIVAYNQPVTRGFIEQIRGVNSNHIVNTLLEKGLLEEAGRLDAPGRPIRYQTTALFLRSFGLSGLNQLPPLEESEMQQTSLLDDAQEGVEV